MVEADKSFELNNSDLKALKFLHEDLVVVGKAGAGA